MRKSLLLTLLLTLAFSLHAKEVLPQQALEAAGEFITGSRQLKGAPALLKAPGTSGIAQPYYVFNSEGTRGFVIISGDDRAPKVLGYSDSGYLDSTNLPPQLKAMLDRLAEHVKTLPDVPHHSWKGMARGVDDSQNLLIPTANWGQRYPYNTECPTIDGEPTLTGCVATAMAIVMKHHNWPDTYDWDAMPMNTEEDPLDFEKASPELARLMHEAGEAVFMEYDTLESGAYLDWIGHRMQYVFNYSPDCQYLGWENFDFDRWVTMLRSNLDEGNPVIYDGFGTGGHHAFVIDGYNNDDYHVNWGWNGMGNGYFPLMDLTPFEGENYSEHQGMVINILPDREKREYSECFVDFGYLWVVGANRMAAEMNVSVENIETGSPFHLFETGITVPAGFEGQIGVAIVDEADNIKEVLRTQRVSTYDPSNNTYTTTNSDLRFYDLMATHDIVPTDRLQLVSKHDRDKDFKLMLGTIETPSSRPVTGNHPLKGSVTFNIGEGIGCTYHLDGADTPHSELPAGETKLEGYIGEVYGFSFYKLDPDGSDPMYMLLHGKFFGGDTESWIGHEPNGFSLGVFDAVNSIDISLIHLDEKSINLERAGTLKDKIEASEAQRIGELTLTGKMNATDFWFLRDNCKNLSSLDLSSVSIEEYTGGDGKDVHEGMHHPANTIPYLALPSLVNLETLILPDNLESIEACSLQNLNLTSIRIPAGVKSIGQDAFYGNATLEAVEALNPEVIEIGMTPFDGTKCPAEGALFVPEGAAKGYAQANVWKDFGRIIEGAMPDPLKFTTTIDNVIYECYIDEARVIGWDGEPVDVVIPETFEVEGNTYTVTAIGNDAFNQCMTLESFKMPNSIRQIGYNAFYFCVNLKELELSENIEEIQYGTFQYCSSLEHFAFSPNIRYIGSQALFGTGISKIVIPGSLLVNTPFIVFGNNHNLEEYVVDGNSSCFAAIDGVLYRVTERGLSLEAVPGKRTGSLEIPGKCREVMRDALCGAAISQLIFNEGLESLQSKSIKDANVLTHLSLPKSVNVQEDAISGCPALESVTFHDTPTAFSSIFLDCPNLRHIYVNADEDVTVSLDGLFPENYENLNVFSPGAVKNFEYSGAHTIFVPGAFAENYSEIQDAEVKEMWAYLINRAENYIGIVPKLSDINIDKVTVNGNPMTSFDPNGHYYHITMEETPGARTISDNAAGDDLDVKVDYTLHGNQPFSTHYDKDFNATIEDIETGMDLISNGVAGRLDVYTPEGMLLFSTTDKADLQQLKSGVYIIRTAGKTVKIMVNK